MSEDEKIDFMKGTLEQKVTMAALAGGKKQSKVRRFWALVLSVLVLGVVVGCSSGLLGVFLEEVEKVFLGYGENSSTPAPVNSSASRLVLSITVGGLLVAVTWWWLRNKTAPVPTVKAAVGGTQMPWWQTIVHVVAQIFFVGTGASIGREVAPREAGSMIAQQWMTLGERLGLEKDDSKLLVAAAAGAGFAGVYISPLTGMFFAVEILLKKIDRETVSVSLAMSAIATVVGGAIKGTAPYYAVGNEAFLPALMVFVVIFSPVFGVAGAWFRRASQWAEREKTTGTAILWQLPLAALVTGVIAIVAPQVMGNGRSIAQLAMSPFQGIQEMAMGLEATAESGVTIEIMVMAVLLTLCAVKAGLTVFTIKAGASGGTLTPSIAIGACLGSLFGILWTMAVTGIAPLEGFDIPLWQCAVAGAVAVLAASQQAPLMAMMMLIEITHLPVQSVVPLGLAAAISVSVAHSMLGASHRAAQENNQSTLKEQPLEGF